jgi:DNA-binding transcriptional LysR family regulator
MDHHEACCVRCHLGDDMDYLDSLRVFHSVVEARSFRRAADNLGISVAAVSRAISGLETRLDSRLFHRTTRQISMTEAAERFYAGSSRILDDLAVLEAEASMQTVQPSTTVS